MKEEKKFETKVKQYLESSDCWYVKYFANRNTKAGIPDILACINGYFVGIEVKAESGKPSKLQLKKIDDIRNGGGFAFVLYPSGFEKFKEFVDALKMDCFNREMPKILE